MPASKTPVGSASTRNQASEKTAVSASAKFTPDTYCIAFTYDMSVIQQLSHLPPTLCCIYERERERKQRCLECDAKSYRYLRASALYLFFYHEII